MGGSCAEYHGSEITESVCFQRSGGTRACAVSIQRFNAVVQVQVNAASVGKVPIAKQYGNITVANVHAMIGTYDQVSPIEPGMTHMIKCLP